MPKQLSDEEYFRVITYKNDMSMNAVHIADELQIARQTVAAIIKRHRQTGSPLPKIKGRKKKTNIKTTVDQDRAIAETSTANPFFTPQRIKDELHLDCSLTTIKRRLREIHLFGRRAAVRVFLTEEKRLARMEFARVQQELKRSWKKVMFTDEVLIQTSAHGMTWVRRPPNMRYENKYVAEVNRNGRCRLMVWGAITSTEMLDLVIIEGRLNKHKYINTILNPIVLPYFQDNPNTVNCYQHDGAPPHRANIVKAWFREHDIELLSPWPANSPDLNLIENLWNQLKEEIGPLNNIGPNQTNELIVKVKAAWDRLRNKNPNPVMALYRSMPRRLAMVKRKNGWQTKY